MKKTYKKALLVFFSAMMLVTNASFAFAQESIDINELNQNLIHSESESITQRKTVVVVNEFDLNIVNQYIQKLRSTLQFTTEQAQCMLESIHPDGIDNWNILLDYAYGYENEIYDVSIINNGIQIMEKKFDILTSESNLPMSRASWQVADFKANFIYNVDKEFYSYGGYTQIRGNMNYSGKGGVLMRVTGPNGFMVDRYYGSGYTNISASYNIPSGSARVYWEKIPWAVDKNNISLSGSIWFGW